MLTALKFVLKQEQQHHLFPKKFPFTLDNPQNMQSTVSWGFLSSVCGVSQITQTLFLLRQVCIEFLKVQSFFLMLLKTQ